MQEKEARPTDPPTEGGKPWKVFVCKPWCESLYKKRKVEELCVGVNVEETRCEKCASNNWRLFPFISDGMRSQALNPVLYERQNWIDNNNKKKSHNNKRQIALWTLFAWHLARNSPPAEVFSATATAVWWLFLFDFIFARCQIAATFAANL